MFTADKADWSYLAAMFDGEGTFSIARAMIDNAKYKAKSNDSGVSDAKPYVQFQSRIEVCNTNLNLMQWLIQNFGGVFYPHRREKAIHKTAYYWRPKGKANNERILLGVLPYLKIKKAQAVLMLEYVRLDRAINSERREAIYAEMKILNRRGLPVETNTSSILIEEAFNNAKADCRLAGLPEPTVSLSDIKMKIESELVGDNESVPGVNRGSECCKAETFEHPESSYLDVDVLKTQKYCRKCGKPCEISDLT